MEEKDYKNESMSLADDTGGVVEKPKKFKKTLKAMISYIKKSLPLFVMSILFAIISTVLILLGPQNLAKITDIIDNAVRFGTSIDMKEIANIGFLLVALYIGGALFSYLQGQIMADVSQNVAKRMRGDLNRKISRLPMYFYHKTSTGDIMSRIGNDADSIGQNLNNGLRVIVSSIAMLIGSTFLMFYTNALLAVAAIGATLVGMTLLTIIIMVSQKYFVKQQKYLGKINGLVEETYSGQTIVKAYDANDELRASFIKDNDKLKNSSFGAQFLSGIMFPIMIFIDHIGYIIVCIVGAVLVIKGEISIGVVVAFIMYIRHFSEPLTEIVQAFQSMQTALAAGERVFEFIDEEEMPDELDKTIILENVKGNVQFENVQFSYEGSDKIIINDFSTDAKAGQKIAIVGPTGAGKTTLINVLMRYNEIQKGDIKIDGTSIYDISKRNLRNNFCMVLQDTWLFEGTVRENVVYSKENISHEKVIEACQAVGIHHFIDTLPSGYDTILNEQTTLSEGQKQQITIARAMIQDAPMLILDEATSSVDTRTEVVIQKAMDRLMENRTAFVIAHRLSTIKNADKILVLKDGDIVEQGSHNALLEQKGFYSSLYNSQFEM